MTLATVTQPKPVNALFENGIFLIDLSRPCSVLVRGYTDSGTVKEYLLRVSDSGKLSLV
jgi:hypothetical protein